MAWFDSPISGSLSARLCSIDSFLEAVEELRTKLLRLSPSYIVSDPEKLISLVEVAKNTLQRNGVSLHTFSSCPDKLAPHKAAYFGLLLQLQAHIHGVRLGSKDLQDRLSRLLFPLSTQLRVCRKEVKDTDQSQAHDGTNRSRRDVRVRVEPIAESLNSYSSSNKNSRPTSQNQPQLSCGSSNAHPAFPPNAMLPPDPPIHRSIKSYELTTSPSTSLYKRHRRIGIGISKPLTRSSSSGRESGIHRSSRSRNTSISSLQDPNTTRSKALSNRQLVFAPSGGSKRAGSHDLAGNICIKGHIRGSEPEGWELDGDLGVESEEEDEKEETTPLPTPSPLRSPLKRSFGIFCTGKGRGAFSGSYPYQRSLSRQETLAQ